MDKILKVKNLFIDERVVSAKEYARMYETDKSVIRQTKIIPPKLGESGFGKIKVTLTATVFDNVVKQ